MLEPAPAPDDAVASEPSAMTDPGPLAERWRLPKRIVDGRTGLPVSDATFFEHLANSRVVYVAEKHTSPHDHAAQVEVLAALLARSSSVAIGLEMVKRPFQKWLSDYVAGRIDEEEFLERTEWAARWGYDFLLYRPILELARQHGIDAHALNARDEITRAVASEGIDALDHVDRATIPDLDLNVVEHRAMVKAVFDAHPMGSMTFENFYTAQVIWDETMAYEVAGVLAADDAPEHLVVFAGAGHIRYRFGIPDRAARRGAKPYVTILPVIEGNESTVRELVEEGAADYLWVMTHGGSPGATVTASAD